MRQLPWLLAHEAAAAQRRADVQNRTRGTTRQLCVNTNPLFPASQVTIEDLLEAMDQEDEEDMNAKENEEQDEQPATNDDTVEPHPVHRL